MGKLGGINIRQSPNNTETNGLRVSVLNWSMRKETKPTQSSLHGWADKLIDIKSKVSSSSKRRQSKEYMHHLTLELIQSHV